MREIEAEGGCDQLAAKKTQIIWPPMNTDERRLKNECLIRVHRRLSAAKCCFPRLLGERFASNRSFNAAYAPARLRRVSIDCGEIGILHTGSAWQSREKAPVFLLQAKNDYSLGPSHSLSKEAGRQHADFESKIYPAFGRTEQDGH